MAQTTSSIEARIDRAFQRARDGGRIPTALALGKDDFPMFQTWIVGSGAEVDPPTYRGVRVRGLKDVFLSRLELIAAQGAPNAILL